MSSPSGNMLEFLRELIQFISSLSSGFTSLIATNGVFEEESVTEERRACERRRPPGVVVSNRRRTSVSTPRNLKQVKINFKLSPYGIVSLGSNNLGSAECCFA